MLLSFNMLLNERLTFESQVVQNKYFLGPQVVPISFMDQIA